MLRSLLERSNNRKPCKTLRLDPCNTHLSWENCYDSPRIYYTFFFLSEKSTNNPNIIPIQTVYISEVSSRQITLVAEYLFQEVVKLSISCLLRLVYGHPSLSAIRNHLNINLCFCSLKNKLTFNSLFSSLSIITSQKLERHYTPCLSEYIIWSTLSETKILWWSWCQYWYLGDLHGTYKSWLNIFKSN